MSSSHEKRGAYLKNKSMREVSERLSMVTEILDSYKQQKLRFDGISHLSDAIATAMSEKDKNSLQIKNLYEYPENSRLSVTFVP